MSDLIDPNRGADGSAIDWRQNERAGVLGTILLLQQIARSDSNPDFRREAAHQAMFLRSLLRRRNRDGRDTLDGALREALEKLMGPAPKQLPPPNDPLVIENGAK